jgi:hypothetical protein
LVHNCDFANNQPQNWADELADMERVGFKPAVQGTKEFDAIVNSGDPFLWVLRSDKTLAVGPQKFGGIDVKHSMLAGGECVCGAGMGQSSFGALKLNNHSGHYWKDTPAWRAVTGAGRGAFEALGFPVLARDLGLVR